MKRASQQFMRNYDSFVRARSELARTIDSRAQKIGISKDPEFEQLFRSFMNSDSFWKDYYQRDEELQALRQYLKTRARKR